ncbi:MAG: hypothetical protein SFW63_06260 [Alphaproteobacteria bacterium]|nr:hypothetical protein [Alphaproteobacteria bacterium]
MTVRKTDGGHVRAYLGAADGVSQAQLNQIIEDCAAQGWQCTPYNLDGKPVLQVDGFGLESKFIHTAEEKGWLSGASTYKRSKDDHVSFGEALKKRSLAASGLFYLIGDAAFMTYGYKGAGTLNTVAGGLYGAGTASLLTFGRKDQSDLQIRDVAKKLAQYMKEHGADLSKDCSLDSIIDDSKRGLIQKADDVLRRYPSELMNLFYAGAGACIAKSAYDHSQSHVKPEDVEDVFQRKFGKISEGFPNTKFLDVEKDTFKVNLEKQMNKMHKLEGQLDIGLGGMTGASGLFAMLVKEKGRDPDAEPKKGAAGLWEAIQQKPLAIAGVGYMVSTLCHAVSTTVAWNNATSDRRKSVPFRAIFVGANLVAEVLLAISSKGHGSGVKSDTSVDDTVVALAAEAIAKQPAKMQQLLIEHTSKFLGRPDTLALKDYEVAEKLTRQVELMRQNPWALASSHPNSAIHAVPAKSEVKSCATKRCKLTPPAAAWQGKMAEQKASQSTAPQITG